MEENRKLVNEILDKGYLMSLATLDEGGLWASDLIFVHDDQLNLFWLSEIQTRHSQAILKNTKVAATISLSHEGGQSNIGLQIEGVVEKMSGEHYELTTKLWVKRHKPIPPEDEEIVDENECWWKLQPTKIEIIYEPLWGFEKKQLAI